MDWPLGSGTDSCGEIPWALINIVSSWEKPFVSCLCVALHRMLELTQYICNENPMELCRFHELGKLDPMLDVVEVRRLVFWMAP